MTKLSTPSTERRVAQLQRRASMITLIDEINSASCGYWRASGQDRARESEIKQKLDSLGFQADVFFLHAKDRSAEPDINSLLIKAHNTITGGKFEGSDRPSDSAVVAQTKQICKKLTEAIANLDIKARRKPRRQNSA
jgi:hypothetical protein